VAELAGVLGCVANRLIRAEAEALRKRTRELYEQGKGCRSIASVLGEDPVATYKRLRRMGVVRSRDEAYGLAHCVEEVPIPFGRLPSQVNVRSSAIGEAVRWFLERGYIPSIPLEPTRYDLVVESDSGFKRVQVKSSTFQDRSGAWVTCTHRTQYDSTVVARGTAGKRRKVRYTKDEVDWFFIVVGDGSKYLIPLEVVGDTLRLSLGKKYENYKI
jgi:hypothetical protein